MGWRELLAPIAADKGEGNAARLERIGNTGDRLAGKMGVEQSAVDPLAFERLERVAGGAGRPYHGESRPPPHSGGFEGCEDLVSNNEDALCCHPCSRLSAEAKTRVMLGGEVDLNWAVRSSPFPAPGSGGQGTSSAVRRSFPTASGKSSRRSSLQTDKRPP